MNTLIGVIQFNQWQWPFVGTPPRNYVILEFSTRHKGFTYGKFYNTYQPQRHD